MYIYNTYIDNHQKTISVYDNPILLERLFHCLIPPISSDLFTFKSFTWAVALNSPFTKSKTSFLVTGSGTLRIDLSISL